MLSRTKVVIGFAVFLSFPCFIESSVFSQSDSQVPLSNIAVVTERLRAYSTSISVSAECLQNRKSVKRSHSFGIVAPENIERTFTKKIKTTYRDASQALHLYRDFDSITNLSEYLVVLVPYIRSVEFSYNTNAAINRKINRRTGDAKPIEFSAVLTVAVEVLDDQHSNIGSFESTSKPVTYYIHTSSCYDLFEEEDVLEGGPFGVLGRAIGTRDPRPLMVRYACALIENTFVDAVDKLFLSLPSEVASVASIIAQQRALPSSISLAVKFLDSHSFLPNNMIDAGEHSEISVRISNEGEGSAYGTSLQVLSDKEDVFCPASVDVGDIPPGEFKVVKVGVKADLDIAEGLVAFQISCREKRGYDSKTYKLKVQTARYERPELTITGYKINDGSTGLGSGNGNGIPENGETIELIVFIRNEGVGKAVQVNLDLSTINQGIDVKQTTVTIPEILAGQTVTGSLSLFLPRTYPGGEIEVGLTASDVRGAAQGRRLLAIKTEAHQPVLAYNYRIIDRDGDGFLENGEQGEIEIVPMNRGRMDARDIRLNLGCEGLTLSNAHMEIERLAGNTKWVPLRFFCRVPRTYTKDSASLHIEFEQKDFPGLKDTINIPTKPVLPDLRVTHQVIDPNNNGIMEQGETVNLIVRVRNAGALDAKGVVLHMAVPREGVTVTSERRLPIGLIPAGGESQPMSFTMHVRRSTVP
jgi:hypothetical protein